MQPEKQEVLEINYEQRRKSTKDDWSGVEALRIANYILSGMICCGALVVICIVSADAHPRVFASLMVLTAILLGVSGFAVRRRGWWIFSVALAMASLFLVPLGTIYGICSLVILFRAHSNGIYSLESQEYREKLTK